LGITARVKVCGLMPLLTPRTLPSPRATIKVAVWAEDGAL
jgi:hypothetical protein